MSPVRSLEVRAHELGGTQGPLLLLLHANGFHGRVFLPMVPLLAPHFRCVALDLPGHGTAPTPSHPFTAEELLGAVRNYVESHDVKDCYCFGHSLGGALAALLQHERPQTFRAMFLFEPVIRPFRELSAEGAATTVHTTAPSHEATGAPAGSGGCVSGGGCGPSPSLLSAPPPTARSESVLARIARKRQAVFPGLEAAKASLGSKPPFNTWHPQALHAYLACGGLRPLGCMDPAVPTTVPSCSLEFPASAVTLSCSAENEARVYEALDLPPWRPWRQLATRTATGPDSVGEVCRAASTTADGATATATPATAMDGGSASNCFGNQDSELRRGWEGSEACSDKHRGGDGGGGGAHKLEEGGKVPVSLSPWRGCRLAIAVGREVGLHARLARWGAQVAEQVPGAQLIRFEALHHLGPMEDPQAVATAALQFFFGLESAWQGAVPTSRL